MLPEQFLNRMEHLLGEEYKAFLKSYENTQYKALRLNPLKVDRAQFLVSDSLQPVPWEENGFYYTAELQPGKHPYHEAGVYYIQEPSAMMPVNFLDVKPGERILDLCAAPGGKSTQIAGKMQGRGLLVCNEIHPARAKILSENIERMGVRNALVTNETPQKLADTFLDFFDKVLVDAPCSGEGMFRKNEEAFTEWSPENVMMCAERQDEILDCAAKLLRPGGRLVYSTCTFAPDEDEGTIYRFLCRHPEYEILSVEKTAGMDDGVPVWVQETEKNSIRDSLIKTIRLWPHHIAGEGHYAAVLKKAGAAPKDFVGYSRFGLEKCIQKQNYQEYLQFQKQYLKVELKGVYLRFGEQLYLAPENTPSLRSLRVLRPGLHLGTILKGRFEPSHALALALKQGECALTVSLSSKENEILNYLHGQTFHLDKEKGWYLISVDGYSIGWGKLAGGIMKNHYPKGLRRP